MSRIRTAALAAAAIAGIASGTATIPAHAADTAPVEVVGYSWIMADGTRVGNPIPDGFKEFCFQVETSKPGATFSTFGLYDRPISAAEFAAAVTDGSVERRAREMQAEGLGYDPARVVAYQAFALYPEINGNDGKPVAGAINECDFVRTDVSFPEGEYTGGGDGGFTSVQVKRNTTGTRPVYETRQTTKQVPVYATKTAHTTKQVQVDRYSSIYRKGTWIGKTQLKRTFDVRKAADHAYIKGLLVKNGQMKATQTIAQAVAALDADQRLSFREDKLQWPASTHTIVTVSSADGNFAKAIQAKAKMGTITGDLTGLDQTTAFVLGKGATAAKPFGANGTVAQDQFDKAGVAPKAITTQVQTGTKTVVTGTTKVQTGTETYVTGTETKTIPVAELDTYLANGWTKA